MPRKKQKPNRSDGLYEVKITIGKTIDGKLERKSFYSNISKEDARRQAEEWKIQRAAAELAGKPFIEKSTNFQKWALTWLEVYKKGKVRDNTYLGSYENPVMKHLIPYFGKADLDEIKPADIQVFLDAKSKQYATETVKKMKACLYAIFQAAIDNDLCVKNPVTRNLKIKQEPTIQKRFYTEDQVKTIIEFAKTHKDGLPIIVMVKTGISRSELLGLRWSDVDLENKILYIRQGVAEEKSTDKGKWVVSVTQLKNAYRKRAIPMDNELYDVFNRIPKTIEVGGNQKKGFPPKIVKPEFVFHDSQGRAMNPSNWSARNYKRFMEDMHAAYPNIPKLNPHELRHTAATLLVNRGVDLFAVAKIMGHADLDMLSKRYAHSDIKALKEALGIN